MSDLLVVTSRVDRIGDRPLTILRTQLDFLESMGLKTELLIDPSAIDFELKIRCGNIGCVYLTPLRCPDEHEVDTRLLNRHIKFTRLLQHLGQPFIGQDFTSQLSINDKMLCSFISQSHPPGWLITREDILSCVHVRLIDEIPASQFPVLVKPNTLWASLGISHNSIANTKDDLSIILTRTFERFAHLTEVRVEVFIRDAREATVSVVGNCKNVVVGVTELISKSDHICLNDEEEKTASSYHKKIGYRPWPLDLFRPQLEQLGKDLFEKFAFRDIARFDVMVREKLFVVDVNDMPFLGNAFCCDWTHSHGIESNQLLAITIAAFNSRMLPGDKKFKLPEKFWQSLPSSFWLCKERRKNYT